jgi:hypothetical protein
MLSLPAPQMQFSAAIITSEPWIQLKGEHARFMEQITEYGNERRIEFFGCGHRCLGTIFKTTRTLLYGGPLYDERFKCFKLFNLFKKKP